MHAFLILVCTQIKESSPDIIGFQEVRAHKEAPGNQVLELQQLLPQYRWHVFEVAHEVAPVKDTYVKGYEMEGMFVIVQLEKLIHLFSLQLLSSKE